MTSPTPDSSFDWRKKADELHQRASAVAREQQAAEQECAIESEEVMTRLDQEPADKGAETAKPRPWPESDIDVALEMLTLLRKHFPGRPEDGVQVLSLLISALVGIPRARSLFGSD